MKVELPMRIFETPNLSIDKVGSIGGEAYLVCAADQALLYDTGFAYSAPETIQELEGLLAEKPLDYIFISHSHYDHVSGSVWIKKRWPHAVIMGSAYTNYVLGRSGARKTMLELNKAAAAQFYAHDQEKLDEYEAFDYSPLEELTLDKVVEEGERIALGSVTFEVIASPGHTRCSLMLWCPEERLLLGSESLGVLVSKNLVSPAYLTSYTDSLESIAKAKALNPQHILANHHDIESGEDARLFLQNAEEWAVKTAQLVWDGADAGKSVEELRELTKEVHFFKVHGFQPEAAFDLNNVALVDLLLSCKPEP